MSHNGAIGQLSRANICSVFQPIGLAYFHSPCSSGGAILAVDVTIPGPGLLILCLLQPRGYKVGIAFEFAEHVLTFLTEDLLIQVPRVIQLHVLSLAPDDTTRHTVLLRLLCFHRHSQCLRRLPCVLECRRRCCRYSSISA